MSALSVLARVKTVEDFQEVEMAENAQVDFFTIDDRKVQTRQTVMLEEIIKRLDKSDVADAQVVAAHEARLRSLEDTRTSLQGQGKLVMMLVGLIAAVVGSGVHLLLDFLKIK